MDNDLDQAFWNHAVSRSEHGILGRNHRSDAYCYSDEYYILEDEAEKSRCLSSVRTSSRVFDFFQ